LSEKFKEVEKRTSKTSVGVAGVLLGLSGPDEGASSTKELKSSSGSSSESVVLVLLLELVTVEALENVVLLLRELAPDSVDVVDVDVDVEIVSSISSPSEMIDEMIGGSHRTGPDSGKLSMIGSESKSKMLATESTCSELPAVSSSTAAIVVDDVLVAVDPEVVVPDVDHVVVTVLLLLVLLGDDVLDSVLVSVLVSGPRDGPELGAFIRRADCPHWWERKFRALESVSRGRYNVNASCPKE